MKIWRITVNGLVKCRRTIYNVTGTEATFDVTGEEQVWTLQRKRCQMNQYVFQNHIYEWATIWATDFKQLSAQRYTSMKMMFPMPILMMSYHRKGGGCNNTGRIADVSYQVGTWISLLQPSIGRI